MTNETDDLLSSLDRHRQFVRETVTGLTDVQARLRPTASALCLAGIVKHVTYGERQWVRFVLEGTSAVELNESSYAAHTASFEPEPDETLDVLVRRYDNVAARTDTAMRSLPSLDIAHPLPPAPWFEPGAQWSARRVLTHILAETAQHAGHADIIRESIDGAKTMG